jgi:hypothetical protein
MPFSRKETRELDALAQWQIEEIKKALDEADRGEFASDEEVEQVAETVDARAVHRHKREGRWVSLILTASSCGR